MPFEFNLKSYKNLITPYEETRAGFISLALEKSKEATPFIEQAKALKSMASSANKPEKLLQITEIQNSLLTAAGISDKARKYLSNDNKEKAIANLIANFLKPAGKLFVDELVYRFLLTRGDSLGGKIRNIAGKIGERKFTRILISTLSVRGITFLYLDSEKKKWLLQNLKPDIEKRIKGLHWSYGENKRTIIYNINVPIVNKNVDLCLFNCLPEELNLNANIDSVHRKPKKYLALGELKGGIDPAGADEHWKTARSALERIKTSFSKESCSPSTFFIGAAIESEMAKEIYQQIDNHKLKNAANLTIEEQVVALCNWLIEI